MEKVNRIFNPASKNVFFFYMNEGRNELCSAKLFEYNLNARMAA